MGASDQYVRVYDRRMLAMGASQAKSFFLAVVVGSSPTAACLPCGKSQARSFSRQLLWAVPASLKAVLCSFKGRRVWGAGRPRSARVCAEPLLTLAPPHLLLGERPHHTSYSASWVEAKEASRLPRPSRA